MKHLIIIFFCLLPGTTFGQELKIGSCFIDEAIQIKYCIASDSLTYDSNFGDSYRLLLLINSKTDSIIKRYYLDINRSPDFPYSLDPTFLKEFNLLIIQGYATFYVYSQIDKTISGQTSPEYRNCDFSDGQGMMIHDLNLNENGSVLDLQVKECGLHRFNIQNIEDIREIE